MKIPKSIKIVLGSLSVIVIAYTLITAHWPMHAVIRLLIYIVLSLLSLSGFLYRLRNKHLSEQDKKIFNKYKKK